MLSGLLLESLDIPSGAGADVPVSWGWGDTEAQGTSKGTRQACYPYPPTDGPMPISLFFAWNRAKPGNYEDFGEYHLQLECTGGRGPSLASLQAPHIAGG